MQRNKYNQDERRYWDRYFPILDDIYPIKMYDLLLPDIRSKDIHEEISEKLRTKYLSDFYHAVELKEVNGVVFGPYYRVFVSLPVKIMHETKNVHFLLDTGSPKTFICEEVYESFKANIINSSSHKVLVNNKSIITHLPPINSHFTDVNVLGMEYLKTFDARFIVDFENEYVTISFGSFNHDENQNDFQHHTLDTLGVMVGFSLFGLGLFLIFKRRPYFFFSIVVFVLFFKLFFTSILTISR